MGSRRKNKNKKQVTTTTGTPIADAITKGKAGVTFAMERYQGTLVKKCRHEPTPVFEKDGIVYHACSKTHVPWDWDGPIVNLLGDKDLVRADPRIFASDGWDDLEKYTANFSQIPDCIVIDWRDGGIPPVQKAFWSAFHQMALTDKRPPLFYCWGGHGRTGTALASMMLSLDVLETADKVMSFIRTQYCTEAIETFSQESYLYRLNGEDPPPAIHKASSTHGLVHGYGDYEGWGW